MGPQVEPGIAAKRVSAARADDQARAPEHDGGLPHATDLRKRLRYVSVDLETEMIAEEEAEATTATELVFELETAVIPRVASERAHLYLAAMLRGEGPDPASQQQPNASEHPHRRTPLGHGNGRPPKIGVSLRIRDTPRTVRKCL